MCCTKINRVKTIIFVLEDDADIARLASHHRILVDFLKWMVGDGQKVAPQLTCAPLPAEVAKKVLATIGQLSRRLYCNSPIMRLHSMFQPLSNRRSS